MEWKAEHKKRAFNGQKMKNYLLLESMKQFISFFSPLLLHSPESFLRETLLLCTFLIKTMKRTHNNRMPERANKKLRSQG